MKKLLFIMMALVAAQSVQAEESKIDRAKRYGWKTAKVAFHTGEIVCGVALAFFAGNVLKHKYKPVLDEDELLAQAFVAIEESIYIPLDIVRGLLGKIPTGNAEHQKAKYQKIAAAYNATILVAPGLITHGVYGLAKELGVLAGIKAGYKKIKEQKKIKLKQA